jgi:hypothetical protein
MDLGVTRSIGSKTNSSPTSLLLLEREVNRKARKKGRGKETNCWEVDIVGPFLFITIEYT